MIGASLWGSLSLNDADGFRNMGVKNMKRTAIYCRVSTSRQEKEGDSIPAQLDALREYIRQRGDLIPAGEYVDAELTALKASEPRKTAPAVRLDKVFASDFETVYTALNASERRRLWRSVIKEIRMDAGKNLDIIRQ